MEVHTQAASVPPSLRQCQPQPAQPPQPRPRPSRQRRTFWTRTVSPRTPSTSLQPVYSSLIFLVTLHLMWMITSHDRCLTLRDLLLNKEDHQLPGKVGVTYNLNTHVKRDCSDFNSDFGVCGGIPWEHLQSFLKETELF